MPLDIQEWIKHQRARHAREIRYGGDQSPCPFCGVPRCSRSDYIRCERCGINWDHGTDYSIDPRLDPSRRPPGVSKVRGSDTSKGGVSEVWDRLGSEIEEPDKDL